jgi:fatty acid desaturase
MTRVAHKSYRLSGGTTNALELRNDGFEKRVEGQWFSPTIDRKHLKQLMQRSDAAGLRHFGTWIILLIGSGSTAYLAWGTLWCVPAFAAYGVFYAMSDHHAHELSHGTPFKSRWLNEILYHLNAFMTLHEGYYWRWSHSRHHTETIIVGRDPEIAFPRPVNLANTVLDFFFIPSGLREMSKILRHASGNLSGYAREIVPASELKKVVWSSRAYVAFFGGAMAWCIVAGSILPALFIVLPRFYGGMFAQLFNMTQHAGLAEDVWDHRLNTRTVHLNPLAAFLYMNMNYHLEHHMFPVVPFHALPRLHVLIREQCPPAYTGLGEAYREIIPTLLRQATDDLYYVKRPLPSPAPPSVSVNAAAQ